ncbi:MAG: DUF4175 family protein [Rhodothermales bacterium]
MSENSLQLLQVIKERLNATAKRRAFIDTTFGLVILVGVLTGAWLVATGIEAGFWLDPSSRQIALWSVILIAVSLLGWFVIRPLLKMTGILKGPSTHSIAKDVGQAFPQISDKLTNLLHLAEGRRSPSPDGFVDHAVRSLSSDVRQVEFEKMENFERTQRASRIASIPILGLLIFLIAAPGSFLDASVRLLSPATNFDRPAPFQFNVSPGSVELIRGDSLSLEISVAGTNLPERIELEIRNEGEDKVTTEDLIASESGTFTRTFVNVRRSFEYTISAGPVETPAYKVEIVERPIIRSLQVSLSFPKYSKIPPQRLEPNVGDVQALAGTQISLDVGVAGGNVIEAFTRHNNGKIDTLSITGSQALGAFTLKEEGHYQIVLRDSKGIENSTPIKYSLKVLPDAHPSIVLLEPAPLAELNESLQSFLRSRITDDFGFLQTRLYYRLSESRFGEIMPDFARVDLPLQNRTELDQEINFNWIIREQTDLDLVPGDVIEYYIQVWDNDSVAGYKSTKSATHQLRLPSLAEQYQELEKKEDDAQDEMEALLRETREVKEEFQELRDELRNKQESDWEDQRQLEQLKEKQAELESKVEDLSTSFESMTDQMEENDLASDETLEMYQEMQQVLEEINTPELMEALNELQEAMQELNLEQMQESLNNFEQNEDQYQKRLERTLDLFKQLRVQQDLEEVAKRAEDLAKQQEKIQEETEKLKEEAARKNEDGEQKEGEQQDGEQKEGEQQEGEQKDGEQQEGEQKDGEQKEGEQKDGEQKEGEQQEGEQKEGEQKDGEQKDGEQKEGESSPNEELAQKQELSKEEMEQLEQQLQEIMEKMEDVQNAPKQEMQQLSEDVEQQDIPEQMQENADQLRKEQNDQAQQQQQQMQQQLQQMQQGMQGNQMQINIAGLRRALSDILTLSQLQEDLREDVRGLAADSPVMRENAQLQVELGEGLSVVSDTLQKLSAKIPQMSREVQQHAGDAMREMGSSVEAMTERVPSRASGHQKESMMHLNELALLLSDLLNEMMNSQGSGSGGGMSMQQMIQQLQNAAGEQQKLNSQIQQMLNEMQGNRLSQDMQQRLRQMAAQQESIRSEIKSLSRQRELRGKVMGDLSRIADQMDETIKELQRGRPGRKTIERQQQIITRMLDATKSMQERGKEKKREGKEGEDRFRESPDDISPSEKADQLRRALIEALDSGYAPDYEELIKRYFELLQMRSLEQE